MAMVNYMRQQDGIGVQRAFKDVEVDHLVCILRIVERLPILTSMPSADPAILQRQFAAVHENLTAIAGLVTDVLADKPSLK